MIFDNDEWSDAIQTTDSYDLLMTRIEPPAVPNKMNVYDYSIKAANEMQKTNKTDKPLVNRYPPNKIVMEDNPEG